MNFQPDLFILVLVAITLAWTTLAGVFTVIYHTVWWVRLTALAVATVGAAAMVALLAGA